jgi:acetyl esterase
VIAPSPLADVAALLDMVAATPGPGFAEMEPEQARAAVSAMVGMLDAPAPLDITVADHLCPTPDGPLACRSYVPPQAHFADPAVVFLHGGGWITGDLDVYDSFCRFLAEQSGLRVLAVHYRRAPEHPFPAAYEDTLAAARWSIGDDGPFAGTHSIVLAGDSAGGNLAAAATHALIEEGFAVAAQLLLYPVLDVSAQSQSYRDNAEGYLLTRADMEHFITSYVPVAADRLDPRCSPLLAKDLTRTPLTVLLACELDPLRDEARAYAAALAAAGRDVAFLEAKGQIHGLATLRRALPSAVGTLEQAIGVLRQLTERAIPDN